MYTFRFFKEAAEDCGFRVSDPVTHSSETVVELYRKTPEGSAWYETITFTDPDEIPEILQERIDTYDFNEAETWYNEDTGEEETFDSLVDDERWKAEVLTDLLNMLIV